MLLDFCDSDDTREYCSGMYLNNELCLKHMNQKLNELQYFTYYYPNFLIIHIQSWGKFYFYFGKSFPVIYMAINRLFIFVKFSQEIFQKLKDRYFEKSCQWRKNCYLTHGFLISDQQTPNYDRNRKFPFFERPSNNCQHYLTLLYFFLKISFNVLRMSYNKVPLLLMKRL